MENAMSVKYFNVRIRLEENGSFSYDPTTPMLRFKANKNDLGGEWVDASNS